MERSLFPGHHFGVGLAGLLMSITFKSLESVSTHIRIVARYRHLNWALRPLGCHLITGLPGMLMLTTFGDRRVNVHHVGIVYPIRLENGSGQCPRFTQDQRNRDAADVVALGRSRKEYHVGVIARYGHGLKWKQRKAQAPRCAEAGYIIA